MTPTAVRAILVTVPSTALVTPEEYVMISQIIPILSTIALLCGSMLAIFFIAAQVGFHPNSGERKGDSSTPTFILLPGKSLSRRIAAYMRDVGIMISIVALLTTTLRIPPKFLWTVAFFVLLYIFSLTLVPRGHRWRDGRLSRFIFAGSFSTAWIVYPHWLVVDTVAGMGCISFLTLARKLPPWFVLLAVMPFIAADIGLVRAETMQRFGESALGTPATVMLPDTFPMEFVGLGDFAVTGVLVMAAIGTAKRTGHPLIGFGAVLGCMIGMASGITMCILSATPQPGMLYILPPTVVGFVISARWYDIAWTEIFQTQEWWTTAKARSETKRSPIENEQG